MMKYAIRKLKSKKGVGAPALYLLITLFSIAIIFYVMNIVFETFYQLNVANGIMPELTSKLHLVWVLYPLILVFGSVLWFLLVIQREDTVGGYR